MAQQEKVFQVTPISPGIAIGKTLKIGGSHIIDRVEERYIAEGEIKSELEKFHTVLDLTKQSVRDLKDKLKDKLASSEAEIFDTHLMILEDMALVNDIERLIKSRL